MKRPSATFQKIIFALLVIWFLLLAVSYFINRPVTLIGLLPELLLLALIIAAAYSAGSFVIDQLHLEDVLLPGEEFALATALGLGALSLLTSVAGLLGLLTWWTIGPGLVVAFAAGFNRNIGMVTPPTYLFGPEDLGEEAPDPISWLQYIVIAIWIIALANFCFLPPVFEQGLAVTLGVPGQWVQHAGIGPEAALSPGAVSLPDGLFAMALVLRGPHLAMLLSGLLGGLVIGILFLCVKRYCGPVASRSALLVAISLPPFAYAVLAPSGELAVALHQFCAFFCILRWFDDDRRRWFVLSGIFIGLSLAGSAAALLFLPPLLVAIFVWAAIRRRGRSMLTNIGILLLAAAITLTLWLAIALYISGTPLPWLQSLASLEPPPIREGLAGMLSLPVSISFPGPSLPTWEVIGPIFLIFVPFFFITYRKSPASGLAVAVGLAFLAFGEPFGMSLQSRMTALMLLAIPAAMAAHRFVEKGWYKKTAVVMLYLMIGWQIFNSTAMIETIFPSPHRFLIGIESSEEFLARAVRYYPVAEYVNGSLPADARILALGQRGRLYIDRRITIAEDDEGQEILKALTETSEAEQAVAGLQAEGYSHLLVDPRGLGFRGGSQTRFQTVLAERLENRFLHKSNGISLFSLQGLEGAEREGKRK